MKDNYPIVPGRGLNTDDAKSMRLEYLNKQGIHLPKIEDCSLESSVIRNNLESWIGSVEIPIGLAGPLLYKGQKGEEYLNAAVGTLEGALIASMNRGAKVISKSGGFNAVVLHQKMVRSPMFIFEDLEQCLVFKDWADSHFKEIKEVAEQYSNHAELIEIQSFIIHKSVHLKFVYTTGDASGQNMTTICTWHAILWMNKSFEKEKEIKAVHYVIEGNGASDKKVSHYSINSGRGVNVIAECEILDSEIEKILRVKSEDFLKCLRPSMAMSKMDGMIGFNINVANTIAAIFVATGQDLACIHESSIGILQMEKTEKGIYCTLQLPCLVIGTLGGGTHLPAQQEALRLMGCDGNGKIKRFASLIAGFALSLEISTFAAIVGGQFAKAHEKLGRNKPVNWLTKSEINQEFVSSITKDYLEDTMIKQLEFPKTIIVENGIIINLASKVNNKLIGFIPLKLELQKGNKIYKENVLLKSKPLDIEVIKGLHYMAASIDPELADLLFIYKDNLEYKNCHKKEIFLYQLLKTKEYDCTPVFYGSKSNEKREIYLFIQELLDYNQLELINSENNPEKWFDELILKVIKTISEVHRGFLPEIEEMKLGLLEEFKPWLSKALYHKFVDILIKEHEGTKLESNCRQLSIFIEELEALNKDVNSGKTVVHNDFNLRNIAVRNDGRPCIYDWELAMINYPERDLMEFLSFALPEAFEAGRFYKIMDASFAFRVMDSNRKDWDETCIYSLKEFLVTRVTFYLTGKILMDYIFAERIFVNAFRMIQLIENRA